MTPPDPTTIEVSLFGPGVGECVVIHLGANRWFIIDSCVDRDGQPVALGYLQRLGVEPENIVGLLISHWHDDHIGGAARVLDVATEASFYCSAAFRDENLLALVELQRSSLMENSSGADELRGVFDVLRARKERGQLTSTVSPELVKCGQKIIRHGDVELWGLSPSSAELTESFQAFAELLPKEAEPKRRARFDENHASVVVQLSAPAGSVLLGADKEATGSPTTGWTAIVTSSVRPEIQSGAYKVAHHGAPNGDDPAIWEHLLEPAPISFLTPHRPSKRPRPGDVERLKSHSSNVYLTASASGRRPPRSNRIVDKLMNQMADRRELVDGFGQVRLRLPNDGPHTVETFGSAQHL